MSTQLLASKKTGKDVKKLSSPYFYSEIERMLAEVLWHCFSIGIHRIHAFSIGAASSLYAICAATLCN